jgi:hypothetical protein
VRGEAVVAWVEMLLTRHVQGVRGEAIVAWVEILLTHHVR